MGAGAALFDYDADGDLDVFLVQTGPVFGDETTDPATYRDSLFRNELIESGELRFTDVTEASGLRSDGLSAWGLPPATRTATAGSIST